MSIFWLTTTRISLQLLSQVILMMFLQVCRLLLLMVCPQFFIRNIGSLEVVAGILSCLKDGSLLKKINHTNIYLIPKVQNPESVKDFRPISLCNVIYKIIAKVLANRLKKMLPLIISKSHSAFVPGRLISDSILIAFETLHHMQHMKHGRHGYMALKLDMSKAYGRVKWVFLEKIMLRMGFHSKWVSMVMECVRTVSYSVLVNATLKDFFIPLGDYVKGTLFPLTYFSYVRRGFKLFWQVLLVPIKSKAFPSAVVGPF